MITKNRIDQSFGPSGSSAGIFIFIVGILTLYISLFGLVLILAGAFMGFTSTTTFLDIENKRIKFASNFFGILPMGKWMQIASDMKLGIAESDKGFRIFSRSNQALDVRVKDFRIVLYGNDHLVLGPVKKFDSREAAEAGLGLLNDRLGFELN